MQAPAALVSLFRLTRCEYFADFFITPPITLALAGVSLMHNFGWVWVLEFVLGLLFWTFYEYATHRWLLHGFPFWQDVHKLHHDNQRDYVAMPPWATLTLYMSMWLIFGFRASSFAVGFSCGYVIYAALHTAFHYRTTRPGDWLFNLHRRHSLHHIFEQSNFGVSVSWWDKLFGTERA